MATTKDELYDLVARINRATGEPTDGYIAGRYILDSAYGGHKLCRLMPSGGTGNITYGYVSKKELAVMLRCILT